MPGYDGTGPRGLGPMTGGGRGYCVVPLGQTKEEELTFLNKQVQSMRDKLMRIEQRIDAIQGIKKGEA